MKIALAHLTCPSRLHAAPAVVVRAYSATVAPRIAEDLMQRAVRERNLLVHLSFATPNQHCVGGVGVAVVKPADTIPREERALNTKARVFGDELVRMRLVLGKQVRQMH